MIAWFAILVIGCMVAATAVIAIINLTRKEPKPMGTENSPLVFFLSMVGVFSFLAGMAFIFLPAHDHQKAGLALLGIGFPILLGSIFLNAQKAKSERSTWPVVTARCTGRQLEMRAYWSDGGSVDGWLWKVVCEVDYDGSHYVVHPKIHWNDTAQTDRPFHNEELAQRFIAERISPNGECRLRVNPANPLDAELVGI